MLGAFQHSFRKRLRTAPKFYFIDVGIARALAKILAVPPLPSTSYYGELFEQFIVCECIKLASYFKPDYRFSYLKTETDVEIDLVVERPGEKLLLIEIKSSISVTQKDLRSMDEIAQDLGDCEVVCFSCDPRPKKIGGSMVYPWAIGIQQYFC